MSVDIYSRYFDVLSNFKQIECNINTKIRQYRVTMQRNTETKGPQFFNHSHYVIIMVYMFLIVCYCTRWRCHLR